MWQRGLEAEIHGIQKEIHSRWGNRESSPREIKEGVRGWGHNQKYYQGYADRTFWLVSLSSVSLRSHLAPLYVVAFPWAVPSYRNVLPQRTSYQS